VLQSNTVDEKRPKKIRINVALAATLLSTGATFAEIAPQVGAKSANSVRSALLRKGIQRKTFADLPISAERCTNVAIRVASEASERLRERFSKVLDREMAKIEKPNVSTKTLKKVRAIGETIEPLARTAKVVHNWGDGSTSGLVVVGAMNSADMPISDPIDISPIEEKRLTDAPQPADDSAQ
jgi:hypothetical protein